MPTNRVDHVTRCKQLYTNGWISTGPYLEAPRRVLRLARRANALSRDGELLVDRPGVRVSWVEVLDDPRGVARDHPARSCWSISMDNKYLYPSGYTYTLSGNTPRTTAPAATVLLAPIVHGPMMIAPPPIHT